MAKDIEKIIETTVMPEMEYVKTKRRTVTIDEVPEVVLPKTKAEMYEEAKERLDQKTSAVSRAYEKGARKTHKRAVEPEKRVKTVDLESAAAKAVGSASNIAHGNAVKTRSRAVAAKKTVAEPKWVGSSDEMIPFSWREPLKSDIKKPTKFYKAAVHANRDRALLLPTLRSELRK